MTWIALIDDEPVRIGAFDLKEAIRGVRGFINAVGKMFKARLLSDNNEFCTRRKFIPPKRCLVIDSMEVF